MKGLQRRLFSVTSTVFCLAATLAVLQEVRHQLGDESTFTGWTLLASTLGLYLLSARKKWIRLKLGPVAGWLQMHMYMGVFASLVFLTHIGWPIRGKFELALAFAFVFVAFTGVVLGVLNRTTPRRLAAIPRDYSVDQIPALQLGVASDAHDVAMQSSVLGEGATLSEYYQRRLLPYFQSQRSLLYILAPTGFRRRALLRELGDLDRYLGERGLQSRANLAAMIKVKDDLDFHHAIQTRLKILFAAHFALTWSLAILIAVHVVLVYRFQGAM